MDTYDNTEQSPTLNIAEQSLVESPKAAAMPSNLICNDCNTIDLKGNDNITEESNVIHLEEPISSNKVIHRQSSGNLPEQQTVLKKHKNNLKVNKHVRRHIVTKNVALHLVSSQEIGGNMQLVKQVIPSPKPNNNPLNISDYDNEIAIVGIESTKPSSPKPVNKTIPKMGSSQQQIVINLDTTSKNLRPSVICYASRVDPEPVQPLTVTYKTQHVPVSHISGSFQPTSMVSDTTYQLPVSSLPVSLPQASSEISFCQLRYVCSGPSQTHINNSLMVSQPLKSLQPTTPAIPIPEHTTRLTEIQNQKKCTSGIRLLPAPSLTLSRSLDTSEPLTIILSWTMTVNNSMAEIMRYEIFASQKNSSVPAKGYLWKKIAVIDALELPMSCSLTLAKSGVQYSFTIRAEDVYSRVGPLSTPQSVFLD